MPLVMKSEQFQVESYTVSVDQILDSVERTLTLTSSPSPKGIRTKATILFRTTNPFTPIIGAVDTTSIELIAWANASLFNGLYAVLLMEKPVTATYGYKVDSSKPKETVWDMDSIGLQTTTEVPGDFEK